MMLILSHTSLQFDTVKYCTYTLLYFQSYEIEMKYKEYKSYKTQKNYSSHGYSINETDSPAVESMTSIITEKTSEEKIATKAASPGDLKVSNIKVSCPKKRLPSEDMVGNPDITEELTEAEIIQISKIESSQG